ncbi:hypothetical protein [Streptomyces sp. NPDC048623]|uniref:hypothetical protein n=1 Tax=Streptomyces sp. NPDC048623 TaxID=3155761 RepID=UPI003442D645
MPARTPGTTEHHLTGRHFVTATDTYYGPFEVDGVKLRPVFDPVLRTFAVQLWKDGEPAGIHGLTKPYQYADEAVEEINDYLAKEGIRRLTLPEMVRLYGALLRDKNPNGADFQIFLMQIRDAQKK